MLLSGMFRTDGRTLFSFRSQNPRELPPGTGKVCSRKLLMNLERTKEDFMSDPATAYRDAREAHGWVTRELATVSPGSIREYCLNIEKRRLTDIVWKLKRYL